MKCQCKVSPCGSEATHIAVVGGEPVAICKSCVNSNCMEPLFVKEILSKCTEAACSDTPVVVWANAQYGTVVYRCDLHSSHPNSETGWKSKSITIQASSKSNGFTPTRGRRPLP